MWKTLGLRKHFKTVKLGGSKDDNMKKHKDELGGWGGRLEETNPVKGSRSWHWDEIDGQYQREMRKKKQTAKWCRGKKGVEHDYQPLGRKYSWVDENGWSRHPVELPWILRFWKCVNEGCGREKVESNKRPDYDAELREKQYNLSLAVARAERRAIDGEDKQNAER